MLKITDNNGRVLQVPDDKLPDLSPEERDTVELFQRATPSVVNIANIGADHCAAGLLGRTCAAA